MPQNNPTLTELATLLTQNRPRGQVASITRQLSELMRMAQDEEVPFDPEEPVAIGISGGRLRIAFMHPDMARFFGPAWQMPIGAADEDGTEQIVLLIQAADDHRLHLLPANFNYRESINSLPTNETMAPSAAVTDLYQYEQFGTAMSEALLLELGYFSDEELEQRVQQALPLPPTSRWVRNNMRRPFALIANAIASLRTVRDGILGKRVADALESGNFRGLRLLSTGEIPPGGFSSSSAVTVATLNALNALHDLGLDDDLLVDLACQSEYGTGVRAGSLDQATEQKGETGIGTLISSNPAENYRTLGRYPMPSEHIQILFPYSVDRDSEAWRWSWGMYAPTASATGPITAGEMRTLTGKAAELAAILTRLPLNTSFFQQIEADLLETGALSLNSRRWICSTLGQIPLLITRHALHEQIEEQREWLTEQFCEYQDLDRDAAAQQAGATIEALFTGWRDPWLKRGCTQEQGVPLRAMLAYLFGEVAKNFRLINHPEQWVEMVALSQRGDRAVEIDFTRLPDRQALQREQPWERKLFGPERLDAWLDTFDARPFDYNQGLSDSGLADTRLGDEHPPDFSRLPGSNFFRGLALIDLGEAMLKRAFGETAVAVRINAAGQGGYFQVHVDKRLAEPEEVKDFLRVAFYQRFGLSPRPEFVEVHPGGGAIGLRLERYRDLPRLLKVMTAT